MQLKINPEYKSLIPPLFSEEFAGLEKSIKEEGCRDAIVTWQGVIVDGHNRYEICQKHGIDFTTIEKDFTNDSEAKEWIIYNQLSRRNITAYVRAELILKLKPVIAERARENQLANLKQGNASPVCQNSDKRDIESIDTKKELANLANVSHDTIARVEKIQQVATPEIKQALRTGEMSINQAYQDIKKVEKSEKQREAYEKRKEESKNQIDTPPNFSFAEKVKRRPLVQGEL